MRKKVIPIMGKTESAIQLDKTIFIRRKRKYQAIYFHYFYFLKISEIFVQISTVYIGKIPKLVTSVLFLTFQESQISRQKVAQIIPPNQLFHILSIFWEIN